MGEIEKVEKGVWQRFKDSIYKERDLNNEFATKRMIWTNGYLILYLISLFALVSLFAVSPISTEMDMECTTGYVGLDVEANNYIQNYTTIEELPGNWGYEYTHFNKTLLLDHINVNGIDDMRCRASVKAKGPAYLMWLGGW